MKRMEILLREKASFSRFLPLVLVAMALVVTGCPRNQYFVELKPKGDVMQRTLTFYREDGVNTNTGLPNYQAFDAGELAAITALYPAPGLTNEGLRYIARGEFIKELPNDMGGAGSYTHLTNSLGEANLYVERFRGSDDLAGMTERRFEAADQLTDVLLGWSRMQLGGEPGYDQLHRFLDVDFRRDLKNLGAYCWEGQLAGNYTTNADDELAVRFGQYLIEHGYLTINEVPAVFGEVEGDDSQALMHRVQRLVARKMGVPDTKPVPAALAFLGDEATMEKSLDKYLTGTDLYQARLKQWAEDKKQKPDLKQPEPSEVLNKPIGDLLEFDLFGQPDHLTVRLSLSTPPLHSNGRWDETLKQVIWESDIEGRTNAEHFPFFCYANWVQPDDQFQKKHFGRVILAGDDLTHYCLWRGGQDEPHGAEWDAFVAGLKPDRELAGKIDAFRFADEPVREGTNVSETIASLSAYPRELLKTALK